MELKEVKEIMKNIRPGRPFNIAYTTDLTKYMNASYRNDGHDGTMISYVQVRRLEPSYDKDGNIASTGYDKQKAVQQGRNDGSLPSKNGGLKWGHYSTEHNSPAGLFIEHNGEIYLRLYYTNNTSSRITSISAPKYEFYIDGTQVDLNYLKDNNIMRQSFYPRLTDTSTAVLQPVNIKNILSIN